MDGSFVRPQVQFAFLAIRFFCQSVDGEAQLRQYLIVNDVVQEHRVRIECVLIEDDAFIECTVFAD